MQLNLLTRLGARIVMTRAEPPSTVPGAWRDSAISQLEALARANERAAARARRRRRLWTLGLGSLVLLWAVALWRQAVEPPRVPAPMLAHAPSEPAAVAATEAPPASLAAPVTVAAVEAAVVAPVDVPAATAAATVVAEPVPVVATADDEAARKARALARRKAAQQRARAEQEALQRQQLALAAQAEAERALAQRQQQAEAAARDRAAAAERERRQAQLLAPPARRGVAELCGKADGWAAEQRCQERQCWKAEHQADAVCLRLREVEVARLLRGGDH